MKSGKDWSELTPDEKRAKRFENWLSPPDVEFSKKEADHKAGFPIKPGMTALRCYNSFNVFSQHKKRNYQKRIFLNYFNGGLHHE